MVRNLIMENNYIISVKNGENKALACSQVDFGALREGACIKFGTDKIFYKIAAKNQIFYIKEFVKGSPNCIKILEDIGENICVGDELTISYKEYEAFTVLSVINPGEGYRVGETITLKGGILSPDSESGIKEPASFIVLEVNEFGGVLKIGPNKRGKYTVTPNVQAYVTGMYGKNCILEAEYALINNRKLVDKQVVAMSKENGHTFIYLNGTIPDGITVGKLSIEKWEISLTEKYQGDTKINVKFETIQDFTPYYNVPLLAANSFSQHVIFNQAAALFDLKIFELESRIRELENKLK